MTNKMFTNNKKSTENTNLRKKWGKEQEYTCNCNSYVQQSCGKCEKCQKPGHTIMFGYIVKNLCESCGLENVDLGH